MGTPQSLDVYADPRRRDERITLHLGLDWQEGPLAETEMNGVLPEDVLWVVLERLTNLNQGEFRCRENSLAITAIEEALGWIWRRRLNRHEQGVLGLNKPHAPR